MAATTFDTLSTAKSLENAGIERSQAEAIAVAIQSARVGVATKSEFKVTESDFETEFKELKTGLEELKTGFKELKTGLENLKTEFGKLKVDINWLKWLYGIQIVLLVFIFFKI